MTDLQIDIISLIKSALTGEKVNISKSFDWKQAVEIAVRHKIDVLLYYGAYNSQINMPDEIKNRLQLHTFNMINFDANQSYQINQLLDAFNKNNIDYLPLKGAVLKSLYPKTEMRYMSDIDILIKTSQYNKISNIMSQLGFKFVLESNHEFVWKKDYLNAELHKILIPSYNKDYYSYYEDGWKLAKKSSNGGYEMKDEDFLIYIFTHMAKHYRDSGVGIKHFLDIWVFLKSKTELDKNYIDTELKKLQLYEFFNNCMKLFKVWFEGITSTPKTDFMTDWIFSSGAYGTKEKLELSTALKVSRAHGENSDFRKIIFLRKVFPSYDTMKKKYRILKKLPVLLPFMWVVRIIATFIFRREKVKYQTDNYKNMTDENINDYEKALGYVGLNFNFNNSDK